MIYFLWAWQMKDIWWVCTLVSPANLGMSHSSSFPYAVSPACLLPKCWERLHLYIQGRSSSISLVVSMVANINHSILSVLCGITSVPYNRTTIYGAVMNTCRNFTFIAMLCSNPWIWSKLRFTSVCGPCISCAQGVPRRQPSVSWDTHLTA